MQWNLAHGPSLETLTDEEYPRGPGAPAETSDPSAVIAQSTGTVASPFVTARLASRAASRVLPWLADSHLASSTALAADVALGICDLLSCRLPSWCGEYGVRVYIVAAYTA